MPAAVVTSKGMDLINHHDPRALQNFPTRWVFGNQHHLKRFRRGEQYVGRVRFDPVLHRWRDVPMPYLAAPPQHPAVSIQTHMEIVQQRLERTHVNHAESRPVFAANPRQHRKHGGLGLAAGGRGQQKAMIARLDGRDALFLQGPQRPPPQRVDHMVLDEGIELVEGAQSFSEMSSTDDAAIRFRSSRLSSSSRIVRR